MYRQAQSQQLFHISAKNHKILKVFSETENKPVVDESEGEEESPRYQPLHLYFVFLYYAGICPFKPVYDEDISGRWTLSKFWLQQIFCFLVWTANALNIVTNLIIWEIGVHWNTRSSKKYFQCLGRFLYYLQTFFFCWKLYSSQGQRNVEHLLNEIQRGGGASKKVRPSSMWKIRLNQALTFSAVLVAIGTLFLLLFHRMHNFQPGWFQAAMVWGRRRLHIQNDTYPLPETAENVAAGVVHLLLHGTYTWIEDMFEVLFLLPIPLTVWIPVADFGKFMETKVLSARPPLTTERKAALKELILEEFYKLKGLTDAVNQTFGMLMTAWFVPLEFEIIFFFKMVMYSGDGKLFALLVIAVAILLTLILCCATFHTKICCFKSWFASKEARELIGSWDERWAIQVREVEAASVGIGVDGMYEISFSFVCQILAVSITLFIVSYEM